MLSFEDNYQKPGRKGRYRIFYTFGEVALINSGKEFLFSTAIIILYYKILLHDYFSRNLSTILFISEITFQSYKTLNK